MQGAMYFAWCEPDRSARVDHERKMRLTESELHHMH